ncbi:heme exporter protein CcmD [Vreelandella zhanjiangensis]|uniref:heme exporter protein CcmD n=1 Tax=Vreelandella zhanjiangensis TaxID=1121960 RepID=UPI00037FDDB9|nr:heme exporter protein CcmD [Halomonas zhanjiangensis]
MAFSSFSAFLAMGGHAPYVWAAWGVTALLMIASVGHARMERRLLIRDLKRRARRETTRPLPSTSTAPNSLQASHTDDT